MITPQVAANMMGMRPRSFPETLATSVSSMRPMPSVAGMQRQHLEAMVNSSGPPVGRAAGPQQTTIMQPAGMNGPGITNTPVPVGGCVGCIKKVQLGSPSTWPLWAKILVPTLIIGGGIAATVAIMRSRRVQFPSFDGLDGVDDSDVNDSND